MVIRILVMAMLAVLLTACTLPGAAPPPTGVGEITIPFTTVDVTTYEVNPTPDFISPPEVRGGELPVQDDVRLWPAEPKLYVLTSPGDVEQVIQYLPPLTGEAIRETDFDRDIVLVLLRGTSGSSGYATFIERIGWRDHVLTVYAQFWLPARQWYGYTDAAGLPFHVVRIKRSDFPANFDSASLVVQLEPQEVTPTPPAVLPPS